MKRGRADRTLIVAGLATIALGTLLLLDRTGVVDVRFDYMLPAALAAVGAVLLAAGLLGSPRRPSRFAERRPQASSPASVRGSPPASASIRS